METRNNGFYLRGAYSQTRITTSVVHDLRTPKTELKEFKRSLEFYILRSLKRNSTKGSGKRCFSIIISNQLKNYFLANFNIQHRLKYEQNFNEDFQIKDFKRYNNQCDGFYYIMHESFRVKIRKSSISYLDNIESLRKQKQIFFLCVEFTCQFAKKDNN
jgi:hypothetical protein